MWEAKILFFSQILLKLQYKFNFQEFLMHEMIPSSTRELSLQMNLDFISCMKSLKSFFPTHTQNWHFLKNSPSQELQLNSFMLKLIPLPLYEKYLNGLRWNLVLQWRIILSQKAKHLQILHGSILCKLRFSGNLLVGLLDNFGFNPKEVWWNHLS